MKDSKINWTHHTFNPWWGCVRVSEGCVNCYAETMSKRTGNDIWGVDKPRRFFGGKHWDEPFKWDVEAQRAGTRARVFCASMADVFEDRRDLDEWREQLWKTIGATPFLDWLLLTKRPENIAKLMPIFVTEIPDNVWLGTTVENQKNWERVDELTCIPASVHFLSVEPMLEPVRLQLPSALEIEWVICGGESGAKHRPFEYDWARQLRDDCEAFGISFWMKQGGGMRPPHELDELPEDLRIRELPKS